MKSKFSISLGAATLFCFISLNVSAQTLKDAINLTNSERYDDAKEMFDKLLGSQANAKICFYAGENELLRYKSDPESNQKQEAVDAASVYFKKGLGLDPLEVLNNIGEGMVVFFTENDTIKGDAHIAKALITIPKKLKLQTEKDAIIYTKAAGAEIYLTNPRIAKVLAYIDKASVIPPTSPNPSIALGDVYMELNKPSEAVQAYNKATYFDKKNLEAKVKIASIYLKGRHLNEARTILEEVISIDPNFAIAYKQLGMMYSLTGKAGATFANENYKKFLELSGNNLPAQNSYIISLFRAKDYSEVTNLIDELIKAFPAKNYLNRLAGYSNFDKKPADYSKTKYYMEKFFATTTPEKTIQSDYMYYGKALLKLKTDSLEINKGFELLEKALTYGENVDEIFGEIISNGYSLKRYDIVANFISKKDAAGKASISDLMTMGRSYYYCKQFEKADSAFNKVISKEPENIPAYVMITRIYSGLDPDTKLGLAKPKFENLIEKASSDTVKYANDLYDAYSYMGAYFLFNKQDYKNAEYYFKKILFLNPQNKSWVLKGYNSLGSIAVREKDYPTAKKYFMKVLELDPTSADTKKTIEALNKSINYKPQK